jgi:hypothetical protein
MLGIRLKVPKKKITIACFSREGDFGAEIKNLVLFTLGSDM